MIHYELNTFTVHPMDLYLTLENIRMTDNHKTTMDSLKESAIINLRDEYSPVNRCELITAIMECADGAVPIYAQDTLEALESDTSLALADLDTDFYTVIDAINAAIYQRIEQELHEWVDENTDHYDFTT